MSIKQYTVEEAYVGNYKVSKYIDGKLESYIIDNDYNIDGIKSGIESCGYMRAYDIKVYKDKLKEAEERYEFAKMQYEFAKARPLYNSEVNNDD